MDGGLVLRIQEGGVGRFPEQGELKGLAAGELSDVRAPAAHAATETGGREAPGLRCCADPRVHPDDSDHAHTPSADGAGSRRLAGIEAVVLFGSRARGTARQASDWDIAILSHAAPDDERAARRLFGKLERVHPIVMNPESIEEHCNQGIRIESMIARQGRLLAGDWTPPPCRMEDLDMTPEDLKRNLDIATRDLRSAFLALCDAALDDNPYVENVVEDSQQAAETLAKTIVAGFGLSPATVHDLDVLADQLENAYRGRTRDAEERERFAAAIRDTRARWEHGSRSLRPLPRRAGRAAGANRRSHRTHTAAPDDVDSVVRRSKPRSAECRDGGGQVGRYRGEPCRSNERFRPARPRASSPDSSVGRRRPIDLDRVRPGERASSVAVLAFPAGTAVRRCLQRAAPCGPHS